MVLIYVDNVIIMGNNESKIKEFKIHLHNLFSIKDLSPLKYFLGIKAGQKIEGLVLSRGKYTLDILKDSGQQVC